MGVLSPDDKLIYTRANGDSNEAIEAIDVASGERKQMFRVPGGVIFLAVSPDGKTLAIVSTTAGVLHLSRIDVDGSNYRELVSGVTNGQPAWTRDGRFILFVQPEGKNSAVGRMMRIPADGGQPEFTGISAQGLQDLDLSQDGSKIAYSARSHDDELCVLDNVQMKPTPLGRRIPGIIQGNDGFSAYSPICGSIGCVPASWTGADPSLGERSYRPGDGHHRQRSVRLEPR